MASTFPGRAISGDSQGWLERTFDLADAGTLGSLLGEEQIWIAIAFSSDNSVAYAEGAYVDKIMVRKYVSVSASALPSQSLQSKQPDDTTVENPINLELPSHLSDAKPIH